MYQLIFTYFKIKLIKMTAFITVLPWTMSSDTYSVFIKFKTLFIVHSSIYFDMILPQKSEEIF